MECLALGNELRNVAERIGDRERMVHGHMDRFVVQVLLGDTRGAEVDLAAMKKIADELRQPVQLWQACIAQAMLALGLGNLAEAEELVPQALDLGKLPHPEMAIPAHGAQWYTLCEFRGQPENAEPAIRDIVAGYPTRPVFRCLLAHLHAQVGRVTEAKRLLDDLAQDNIAALPFDQEWLYGTTLLAETSVLLGDRDIAAVLYRLLKPWAALNAADHPEAMRGSVSRYLGLLAAMLDRHDEATTHYAAAVAMNESMGARPWLAHTQHDYARTLLTRHGPGDLKRAQKLIDQALSTYRDLHMNTYAEKAFALSQQVNTSAQATP
jgi:tetratricopeptide (TPR) repeat protein